MSRKSAARSRVSFAKRGQPLAGLGELQDPALFGVERPAEASFEFADAGVEGGLADVQLLGRAGEVPVLREHRERFQILRDQFHRQKL